MSRGPWKKDNAEQVVNDLVDLFKEVDKVMEDGESLKQETSKPEEVKQEVKPEVKEEVKKELKEDVKQETSKPEDIRVLYNQGVPVYYKRRNGKLYPLDKEDK